MPRIKPSAPQRLSDERREEINSDGVEETSSGLYSALQSLISSVAEFRPTKVKKVKERRDSNRIEDENLKEILLDCDFYITLQKDLACSDKEVAYLLGNLELRLLAQEDVIEFPEYNECWLYVSKLPGRSMLYFEDRGDVNSEDSGSQKISVKYYQIDGLLDHTLCSGLHQGKTFSLVVEELPPPADGIISISVKVYLRLNPKDTKGLHPSDGNRNVNKGIQAVMGYFFNIFPPDALHLRKGGKSTLQKDIEDLYSAVKANHLEKSKLKVEEAVFHESLLPILRPYQISAVHWMLEREHFQPSSTSERELDPLYIQQETLDGKCLYYNRYNGSFLGEWEYPELKPLPTGGILADEMGLGKTVEVLACILSNQRSNLPAVERLEPCEIKIEEEDESETVTGLEIKDNKKSNETDPEKNEEFVTESLPEDKAKTSRRVGCANKEVINIKAEDDGDCDKVSGEGSTNQILEVNDGQMNGMQQVVETQHEIKSPGDLVLQEEVIVQEGVFQEEFIMPDDIIVKEELEMKKVLRRTRKPRSSHQKSTSDGETDEEPLDPVMETIEEVVSKYSVTAHSRSKRSPKSKRSSKNKRKNGKEKLRNVKKNPPNVSYTKKACNDLYESMIAEYTVKKVLTDKSRAMRNREFFSTTVKRKSLFECACGMLEVEAGGIGYNENLPAELQQVQCNTCGMWQHARCVGYDLTDAFRGDYYCPHCWQERDPIPSGATLIVSPRSIAFQWMDEIQQHIRKKDLKVLYYERMCHEGYTQPRVLANHDIVIVSYETLSKELDYVDLPHCNGEQGRRFRHAKRFMALPSPLPCIQWWRICLDEAQMVEMTSAKTAEMALRLSAVHRWCITGTPIQRSINDLYGLALFIGYHPYCVQKWWDSLLMHPYLSGNSKPLHDVLCNILWRSCKKDVIDQIRIPPQSERIYWLRFCPTEEHFYRRQHVYCSGSALAALAPFDNNVKLESLDRITVAKILDPLLSLRQACCHPQAVKGKKKQFAQTALPKINEWSMENLLASLVKKAKVEAEEALRQCVAALNGLAGVHILLGEWSLAEEKYRSILKLSDEYKQNLKVDTLQKIHTLHNLAEILENGVSASSLTLKDEAKELEAKYLNKCSRKISCAKEAVDPLTDAVENFLQSDTMTCKQPWWVQVLDWSCSSNHSDELVRKVKNDISDYMSGTGKSRSSAKINDVSDANGLRYYLLVQIDDLIDKRDLVLEEMKQLTKMGNEPTEASRLVMVAVDCHLRQTSCSSAIVSVGSKRKAQSDISSNVSKEGNKRKSGQKKKRSSKCDLCEADANLERYEALLFKVLRQKVEGEAVLLTEDGHAEKNEGDDDAQAVKVFGQLSRGNWAAGEIERMLKVVLGFAKSKKLDQKIIEQGNNQIKLMESMKKEYKYLRILWRQLNDQVSAIDELNMAKLRLGLRDTEEVKEAKQRKKVVGNLSNNLHSKLESLHLLNQHELEPYAARLSAELAGGSCDLRKRVGQLFYLQNLEKANSGRHGGMNPDPCPICRKILGEKWSVLQCGHCYCTECIKVLVTEYSGRGGSVKCAVCREMTHHAEISYVDTSGGPGDYCVQNEASKHGKDEEEDGSSKKVKKIYEVKGSHSTKVEAVVRTLMALIDQEPDVKALVFSTFPDILEIIGSALQANEIKFALLKHGQKFQANLNLFKDKDRDVTALLLPVHVGAKGLNLIEATHVILVEPILNQAMELQAIGRVHRIGQTRPTVVHRLIVRDTIEERMLEVFHGQQSASSDDLSSDSPSSVTIGNLRLLFESAERTPDNNPSTDFVGSSDASEERELPES